MGITYADRAARRLSTRVTSVDIGPSTALIEAAKEMPDVIALARGDPDLPTPAHIVEAGKDALDAGLTHYTSFRGVDALRRAIAEKLRRENGIHVDPDEEVLITTGTQEAIFALMLTLLDEGDEILSPDPYYSTYEHAALYAGGRLVSIPTFKETGFEPDVSEIAARITSRTKALILLTPNNPTGAAYSAETIEAIAALAQERDLLVVSDELYEKLIFPGHTHLSIGALPRMRDRTITVNGFSKVYRMTGWRVGYVAGPSWFIRAARQIQRTMTICAPSVSQHAAIAALTGPQDSVAASVKTYLERARMVMAGLDGAGLTYFEPRGTFYVFADVSRVGMTSVDFAWDLLRNARVLVLPGTHYGRHGEGFVRVSVVAPPEKLAEAGRRIETYLRARQFAPAAASRSKSQGVSR